MKKYTKWFPLLLLTVALFGCQSNDEVIVEVGDSTITKKDLYEKLIDYSGEAVIQEMVYSELLEQNFSVSDKELKAELDDIKKQEGIEDDEQYKQFLETISMTDDELEDNIRVSLLFEKARMAGVSVTEKDVKAAYEMEKRGVNVQHILVSTEDEAKKVAKELEKDEDFGKLAKKYSKDEATKDNNGEVGFVGLNSGMDPAFEEAALKLKVNEISEPIPSQFGFHIIKVMSEETRSYEELKGPIEERLKNEQAKTLPEVMTDLKNKTNFNVKNKEFQPYLNFEATTDTDSHDH